MELTFYKTVLGLHVLCMAGVFGGLIAACAVARGDGDSAAANGRAAMRPLNILLLVGFLMGLVLFVHLTRSDTAPAHVHAAIGIKMLLFVALGAFMGMGSSAFKKGNAARGRLMQILGLVICTIAALVGVSI